MERNPYAAPSTVSVTSPPDLEMGSGDFDIQIAFRQGFELMKQSISTWLLGGLVFTVVAILSVITVIGYFVLVPVLVWGGVKLLLNIHDGHGDVKDVFAGFSTFGAALAAMLAIILVQIGISLPGALLQGIGMAAESAALAALGQLVGLVIAVVVGVRFALAPYYAVDRAMSGVEALRSSWGVTRSIFGKLILFMLLSGVAIFAGALLCGVGAIPASAVVYLAWTSAFRQIAGRPGVQPSA